MTSRGPDQTAPSSVEEREANLFAINLLMPEQMVRAAWDRSAPLRDNGDHRRIDAMARKFRVHPYLMVFRLAMLKIPIDVA